MINTALLIEGGLPTSHSTKLQRIATNVGLYNGLPRDRTKLKIDTLESIMFDVVRFLTFRPPGSHNNQIRIRALGKIVDEVTRESRDLGIKMLHTPSHLANVTDDHAYCCFWLERLDVKRRQGSVLSEAYQQWMGSGSPHKFWTWYNTTFAADLDFGALPQVSEQDREDCKLYRWEGLWYLTSTDQPADTTANSVDNKRGHVIYVANYLGEIYIRNENNTNWCHSIFLAGGPVLAAGTILIRQGRIRMITPASGHYRPNSFNMINFVKSVRDIEEDAGVQLTLNGPWHRVSHIRKEGGGSGGKLDAGAVGRLETDLRG